MNDNNDRSPFTQFMISMKKNNNRLGKFRVIRPSSYRLTRHQLINKNSTLYHNTKISHPLLSLSAGERVIKKPKTKVKFQI